MAVESAAVTYQFGEFEVDVLAYELRHRGARVRLSRQPMDLLLLLLERPHELVSREEIARRLWAPGVHTDLDAGIHTGNLKIRQVLGDSRESPRFVETVPGKGYRFVAPVAAVPPPVPQSSPLVSGAAQSARDRRRHNLPAELTSFIGRRRELAELPPLLAASRLLLLTGAGGVGKTRLAVRLARERVDDFRDGVWLVDLSSLSLPDLVGQTIASTLGFREGPQRSARDVLIDTLRDRELLLVLDTCEHLIGSCADLVETLLREAPSLRVIATSREALGVAGEIVYRVPSLSLPESPAGASSAPGDSEATQLFVERAGTVDPTFTASPANAAAIDRLCRRLDGIPLAIELAAARVAVLSPEQIEERLQDRFRLLTGGARTAVPRQRTLEAAIDWSYELLSEDEQCLLSRLSVFPATWAIEAAEDVCSGGGIDRHQVLELLSRLVGKSLVTVDGDHLSARRYRFLDTVHQYARDRLVRADEAERLRERHFEFFFSGFRGALPILRHHNQVACLQRVRLEQDNLRAALDWALMSSPRASHGVELAGALFWFWTKRGLYSEGQLWLEQALAAAPGAPGPLRARALIGLAHMHHFQGHAFDDEIAEALSIGRDEGDDWLISFAVFMQSLSALQRGEFERAFALAVEAEQAGARCGDEVQRAGPLLIQANVAVQNGDYDRAHPLYEEAIAVERRAGESWGLSIVLSAAAGLRIVRDDFEGARAHASEVLSLSQELEDPRGIAWSLDVAAGLLAAGGAPDGAARLWGASDRLLESVSGQLSPEIRWIRARYIDPVRTALGSGPFERARADGRTMALADAVNLARQQALLLG